ncbi:hypothetical protein D044_2770B, partial [Vibrio parahaemolyticus EKP-026]
QTYQQYLPAESLLLSRQLFP